jgi:hypothetical protein
MPRVRTHPGEVLREEYLIPLNLSAPPRPTVRHHRSFSTTGDDATAGIRAFGIDQCAARTPSRTRRGSTSSQKYGSSSR